MSGPSPIDSRLAAWLEEGPTSGPDDGLADALARVHSVGQRPAWLERIVGDTVETTWRAPMTLSSRHAFLLIVGALLATLITGALIIGSPPPTHRSDPRPAAAIRPTSCGPADGLAPGTVATIAGTGTQASTGDGGPALAADLHPGQGIAVGPDGRLYVGDLGGTVRRILEDGTIEVYADGIPNPQGLGWDGAGNLYVISDFGRIVRIAKDRTMTTVAGTGDVGSEGDEGPATAAVFGATTLAVSPAGELYFDDNLKYRMVDAQGVIHTLAGDGTSGFSGDGGPAASSQLGTAIYGVAGVAVAPDGTVYIGDPGNHRVRRVDRQGIIDSLTIDVPLTDSPYGLATDGDGALYIADWTAAHVIRRDLNGTTTVIAGTGSLSGKDDCGPATEVALKGPMAVAVHEGVVYILEGGGLRIRAVVP